MTKTILQIDDEPSIAAALSIRLRAAGYLVIAATNGRAGLAAAAQHRPDAILLDIRMPDIDGFEVCRWLKSDPATAPIPVIFLSANVQNEARKRAMQVGGCAFLSKPYRAAEVLATLDAALAPAGAAPSADAPVREAPTSDTSSPRVAGADAPRSHTKRSPKE